MKTPIYFIFVGILIILMGIGFDEGKLIPNSLKIIVGLGISAYGIYLYLNRRENSQSTPKTVSEKGFRQSYVYLIGSILIGKGVMHNERITSLIGLDTDIGNTILLIISLSLMVSGIILFLKEKKERTQF